MIKKIVMISVVLLLTYSVLHSETINLERARNLALSSSRSLAKINQSIRSAVLDEKSQLYNMLPSVSADYRASINYLNNWEIVNPVDTFQTAGTISVTQKIFEGGRSLILKQISSLSTESARKDAEAEYFNVLYEIDSAYFAVLEAAEALDAENSSYQAAELSLSMAEIRLSNGMINSGDYLKALAEKESRENSRNKARRSLSLSMTKLKSLTGLSAVEVEQIDFSVYENALRRLASVSDEEADALYDEFRALVIAGNPSLAKAALNNQKAEKNYVYSKREYLPSVSATLFSSGLNYSIEKGFSDTNTGGVTLSGKIPLDFWVLQNKLEKSKIARDSAAFDYTGTEISLDAELQTALLNALSQAGSVLSSRRSLEYTQKNFDYVLERYRLSQCSVSDMGDATSMLISSRNNLTKASYGFLQSLSQLRSLCAIDDESKILSIITR